MSLVRFKASNHPQQTARRGATDRDNLGTDPKLFANLDTRFHFSLDVAASPENAKCPWYYTVEEDGLIAPWLGRVWCNPPYSQIRLWVEKAWLAWNNKPRPSLIVMLLPANRTEQQWWHEHVEPYRDKYLVGQTVGFRVEFLRGRQRFVMPGSEEIGPNERPPFGSCLLIWETDAG